MASSWALTLTVYRGHRWGCLGGRNYGDNRKDSGELRLGRCEPEPIPPRAEDYAPHLLMGTPHLYPSHSMSSRGAARLSNPTLEATSPG